MRAVGIKELKARLSEYVRLARNGELVLVTDRDEIVAELGPARHQLPAPGSVRDLLDRSALEGHVTRAERSRQGWSWSPRGLELPSATVADLLDDVRRDR